MMWLEDQGGLIFLIGDIVVVWRAWVFWTSQRTVAFVPVFFLMANLVTSLVFLSLKSTSYQNSLTLEVLRYASLGLSLTTNVSATALIWVKA
jgi:hypothetical protein